MKYIKSFIALSILITAFNSCEKESDNRIKFYNSEYRKGLWITADKSDTLEFIDNLSMVRKGAYYSRQEYSYRVEENNLVITLNYQNEELITHHPILKTGEASVRLGNMYLTSGLGDNSEIFYKD
jgi:hypothetical protein